MPVTLRFQSGALYRLLDEYPGVKIERDAEGCHLLTLFLPDDAWVADSILGYGTDVEVLSPPSLRAVIREKAQKIAEQHRDC